MVKSESEACAIYSLKKKFHVLWLLFAITGLIIGVGLWYASGLVMEIEAGVPEEAGDFIDLSWIAPIADVLYYLGIVLIVVSIIGIIWQAYGWYVDSQNWGTKCKETR